MPKVKSGPTQQLLSRTPPQTWEDLDRPSSLKGEWRAIRDFLAGNARGVTRDEPLVRQLMVLLFSKLKDETVSRETRQTLCFVHRSGESPLELTRRLSAYFEQVVRPDYGDVFSGKEKLTLDPQCVTFIVERLQWHAVSAAGRDAFGDAFEELIVPRVRGGSGQFFTPRNIVRMCIDILDPKPGERVLDPACGTGGFLTEALQHASSSRERPVIRGVDKDEFLASLARAYLRFLGARDALVVCANSLESPAGALASEFEENSFDVVLTNPPFGVKIPVSSPKILRRYDLGHTWVRTSGEWVVGRQILEKQSPQVLFLERCLQMLKEGGRMAIVLPEGMFSNPSDLYIMSWAFSRARVLGVVSLPPETFLPSTHTKTSVLFLQKLANPGTDYPIFFGVAKKCGHDKNGKDLWTLDEEGDTLLDESGVAELDDDLPRISRFFSRYLSGHEVTSELSFVRRRSELTDHILIPEYYEPGPEHEIRKLEQAGRVHAMRFGDLVSQRFVSIRRGDEIGSKWYGTGPIPFVRTSDIVNWEIKVDPVKCVSERAYAVFAKQQDVKEGDILLVNDGTFLIGRVAMVSSADRRLLIQSHLRRIRVHPTSPISSYLLLWLISHPLVQDQIRSKTFTQATISTLGNRLNEVLLPVPVDGEESHRIEMVVRRIVDGRAELRSLMTTLYPNTNSARMVEVDSTRTLDGFVSAEESSDRASSRVPSNSGAAELERLLTKVDSKG